MPWLRPLVVAACCCALSLCAVAIRAETTGSDLAQELRRRLEVEDLELLDVTLPERSVLENSLPDELSVTLDGHRVSTTLRLRRVSVRADGFRLLLQGADGELHETLPPPERTYRGRADDGTLVAASLLPEGLVAYGLRSSGASWELRPARELAPGAEAGLHVLFDRVTPAATCGSSMLEAPVDSGSSSTASPPRPHAEEPADGGGAGATCDVAVAQIAYDSDWEFFEDDCEGDPDNCVAIIEDGLNITNAIYIRDVRIDHRVTAIILREDPETDFWARFEDASDFGAMLSTFRSEWNENRGDIERDVAYLLTGKSRPEYGGLAYVGTVCTSSHYGMGIGGRGYEGIFRHELGHNWSASHSCGAERRYIMCGNSIDAISGYNVRKISGFRDSRGCLDSDTVAVEPSAPYPRPDRALARRGADVVLLDALAGDTDADCDELSLVDFDETTAFGNRIVVADREDPDQPVGLLWVPRNDLVGRDTLRYVVGDTSGFDASAPAIVDVRPPQLVVWLRLDETSGEEAADSSGNDHEGELRGDLTFEAATAPGRFGGALRLTGDPEQYLSLGDDPAFDLRRGLTVSAWVRVDGFVNDGETLVGKGSSAWRLKRDGLTSALRFTCDGVTIDGAGDGDLRGTIPVDDGEWHHVVASYDGRTMALWIDGELDVERAATGLVATNSSSLRIGEDGWSGAIDDVRIWDHGLTEDEASALARGGRTELARPLDGSIGVAPGAELSWEPAPAATAHDVYVGTDRAAVATANPDSPEHIGRRSAPSARPDLEPGVTYWWRVDEVVDGMPVRGAVRSFTTAFAYTRFDEPALGARDFEPGPGDLELGFSTTSSASGGDGPLVGVVSTSSTPTTPVFAHRSVEATTTVGPASLEDRQSVIASLLLQVRSTGYEPDDRLEVRVTDGLESKSLLSLDGGAPLTQEAGTDYATWAARVPDAWITADLVVESRSDSSAGSERYDFDEVAFTEHQPWQVVSFTSFAEAPADVSTWTPAAGDTEVAFRTTSSPSGGAEPLAALVESPQDPRARRWTHRSVDATTVIGPMSLDSRGAVEAHVVVRVAGTGYESSDRLSIRLTNGEDSVDVLDARGGTALGGLAGGGWLSFRAPVPDGWDEVSVVMASSSDSSAGAERFDLRLVELLRRDASGPVDPPLAPRFRRGDTDGNGVVDISDGIRVLNWLFGGGGGVELGCLDAADGNDTGVLDLSDGIAVFAFLFLGEAPPPSPGPTTCGPDATEDGLGCESHPGCAG